MSFIITCINYIDLYWHVIVGLIVKFIAALGLCMETISSVVLYTCMERLVISKQDGLKRYSENFSCK